VQRDEDARALPLHARRPLAALPERDEAVGRAGEVDLEARILLELLGERERELERDILLAHPAGTARARILAAVARVDDHDARTDGGGPARRGRARPPGRG